MKLHGVLCIAKPLKWCQIIFRRQHNVYNKTWHDKLQVSDPRTIKIPGLKILRQCTVLSKSLVSGYVPVERMVSARLSRVRRVPVVVRNPLRRMQRSPPVRQQLSPRKSDPVAELRSAIFGETEDSSHLHKLFSAVRQEDCSSIITQRPVSQSAGGAGGMCKKWP